MSVGTFNSIRLRDFKDLEKRVSRLRSNEVHNMMNRALTKIWESHKLTLTVNTPKYRVHPDYKDHVGHWSERAGADHKAGTLRKGWNKGTVKLERKRFGDIYALVATNPVPYGKYVSEGHKQKKGNYVHYIRAHLVKERVKGNNFIQDSAARTRERTEKILKTEVRNTLRRGLHGK